MKDFTMIISRVNTLLRGYSKKYVKGYIYGLLDWRVISQETHDKLNDVIDADKNIRIVS